MTVREEIESYSNLEDKPILLGLLEKYRWESEWKFVASSTRLKTGKYYQRVWSPTEEGKIIYKYLIENN